VARGRRRANAACLTSASPARTTRRQRDDIVREHGQDIYEHIEANLHWEVFQFLGKLEPVVYVRRAA